MEKIEFYQRSAVIVVNILSRSSKINHGKNRILSKVRGHRKLSKIFYRHFFKF